METLARRFGQALARLPDGETGGDFDWRNATARKASVTRFQLRPGACLEAASFGRLGFADSAFASHRELVRLREEGVIASGVRFLVALPSPYNVVSWGITEPSRPAFETAYEARLLEELDEVCAAIPHAELSIQWDCAHDMQAYDGARTPWFAPAKAGIVERLARIGERVPAGVELGYHLCYGSFGGRHFVEPKDAGAMVELLNALTRAVRRRIGFVHLPVPVERADEAYFEPLRDLTLHSDTEVFLGVVHDSDGFEGTRRRIVAARRSISRFGIATECGFGRRPPESVPALLALHAHLAERMLA